MSAYEVGTGVGALLVCAIGAFGVFKGYTLWSPSNEPQRSLAQNPPLPRAMPSEMPTTPASTTSHADDFFGGTGGATASTSGGTNPAVTDARWHPDYSSSTTSDPTAKTSSTTGLILLVVGVLLLAAGLFQAYQAFLSPSRGLDFPDQVIGMERNDAGSDAIAQAEEALDAASLFNDVELEGALYASGDRLLYIVGGEEGTTDPAEQQEFQAGFEEGLASAGPSLTMSEVDTGSFGGKMWCSDQPIQTASLCVWVDADTFGFMGMAAQGMDLRDSGLEVREAVEH